MNGTIASAAELEHSIGQGGRFALRLPAGEVSVRAVDGDVARVRDLEGKSLAERFDIRKTADALELVAKNRFGLSYQNGSLTIGSHAAELDIELPRRTRVAIDAASTDVSVAGIAGPGRFRTASGDLILTDIGGSVEFEAVSADVRVEAAGPIELSGKTISGDVAVRAPRLTRLELTTTSGDVRVDADLAGKGPYAIRSISGDATLVARGGLDVEVQTVTGDLSSAMTAKMESGPGRRHLVVGRPTTTLTFKSVSGDLSVVEPRDAAVPMPAAAGAAATPPGAPTPVMPSFAVDPPEADPSPEAEAARLEILRSLERGEIDVATAMARLADAEEA
jgi:Putative adhesin